jgi:hypothetical protein
VEKKEWEGCNGKEGKNKGKMRRRKEVGER